MCHETQEILDMIEKMLRDKKHCRKCGRRLYSTESQQEGVCAFCSRKSKSKAIDKRAKTLAIARWTNCYHSTLNVFYFLNKKNIYIKCIFIRRQRWYEYSARHYNCAQRMENKKDLGENFEKIWMLSNTLRHNIQPSITHTSQLLLNT